MAATRMTASDDTMPGLAPAPAIDPEIGKFRRDINALRALAVATVLLFHFHVTLIAGGFVGVDVFFVVSGYLMTRIIDSGLERKRFSLSRFYLARVRRIVPALTVMCLGVLLVGAFAVDPITLTGQGQNAFMSLLFVSNITYALANSYFAGGSESNWFLHTWTLSLEWQFYLLYPLLLLGLSRIAAVWRHKALLATLTCAILCVLTIWICSISEKTFQVGFFILPTRAWELLAGGCIAFAPPPRLPRYAALALHLLGLAAILASAVFFDGLLPWPSAWTILPVAGTAAVLLANANGDWLVLPGVQALGAWSYSIYLWHWPVVAAFYYWNVPANAPSILAGIGVSILLGALSYLLVETRLRDWIFRPRPPQVWLRALAGFGGVCAIALVCWQSRGLETLRERGMSSQTRVALADYRRASGDWGYRSICGAALKEFPFGHLCRFGRGDSVAVAVVGDSHVEEMLPRYVRVLPATGKGAAFIFQDGCPSLPGVERSAPGSRCERFVRAAFDYVKHNHVGTMVLAPAWLAYIEDKEGEPVLGDICFRDGAQCIRARNVAEFHRLQAMAFQKLTAELRALTDAGIKVILVGPDIKLEGASALSLYRKTFREDSKAIAPPIDRIAFEAHTRFLRVALQRVAARSGAQFFNPLDAMCRDGRCPLYDGENFLLQDSHHMRASLMARRTGWYLDSELLEKTKLRPTGIGSGTTPD